MKLFLTIASLFFLSSFLLADNELITTSSGITKGIKKGKVYLYEDIPYALPPNGVLRWKAPREMISSELILPKDKNFCIQRPSNLGGAIGNTHFVGTEDCLYLDVFTPKKRF